MKDHPSGIKPDSWLVTAGRACETGAPLNVPIISFDVRGWAELADAVCKRVRLIRHATSLGAVESTMERRAAIPGQGHLPPSLLRLRVGIEDVDDLWKDLDNALRAAAA